MKISMQNSSLIINDKIIKILPYTKSFLYVDKISEIDDEHIVGHYTFSENDFFYKAHFKHIPITPGVILIEMMGQIGMVCHLIYLTKIYDKDIPFHPILSNVEASFLKEVKINDLLTVVSKKIYFRKNILKSTLELYNSKKELCCFCTAQLHLVFD